MSPNHSRSFRPAPRTIAARDPRRQYYLRWSQDRVIGTLDATEMTLTILYVWNNDEQSLPLFLMDHYPHSEVQLMAILDSFVRANQPDLFRALVSFGFSSRGSTPALVKIAHRDLTKTVIQSNDPTFWHDLIWSSHRFHLDLEMMMLASPEVVAVERADAMLPHYQWNSLARAIVEEPYQERQLERLIEFWNPNQDEYWDLIKQYIYTPSCYQAVRYLLEHKCPLLAQDALRKMITGSQYGMINPKRTIGWVIEHFNLNPILVLESVISPFNDCFSILVNHTREMVPRAITRLNESEDVDLAGTISLIISDQPLRMRGWFHSISTCADQYHVYHDHSIKHIEDAWLADPLGNIEYDTEEDDEDEEMA
jgi:hypothetical protein